MKGGGGRKQGGCSALVTVQTVDETSVQTVALLYCLVLSVDIELKLKTSFAIKHFEKVYYSFDNSTTKAPKAQSVPLPGGGGCGGALLRYGARELVDGHAVLLGVVRPGYLERRHENLQYLSLFQGFFLG